MLIGDASMNFSTTTISCFLGCRESLDRKDGVSTITILFVGTVLLLYIFRIPAVLSDAGSPLGVTPSPPALHYHCALWYVWRSNTQSFRKIQSQWTDLILTFRSTLPLPPTIKSASDANPGSMKWVVAGSLQRQFCNLSFPPIS
jgi:hypothetical protein